jgi:hypothetical protein
LNQTLSLHRPTSTSSSTRTSRCYLLPTTKLLDCFGILLTYIDAAWTRTTENTSHDQYPLLCDITAHHRKHISHDRYTLLCHVTAHAQAARILHSNGPCVNTKKTLLQYCWPRVLPSSGFTCHNIHLSSLHLHITLLRTTVNCRSQDGSVGILMDYGLDGQGSIFSRGKNFLFSMASRPVLGPTKPHIQWVQGALSPGVKWPGCDPDHSLPFPIHLNCIVLN